MVWVQLGTFRVIQTSPMIRSFTGRWTADLAVALFSIIADYSLIIHQGAGGPLHPLSAEQTVRHLKSVDWKEFASSEREKFTRVDR